MLEKQQPAPLFTSPNQNDAPISLSDYAGKKNVVLYFYPKTIPQVAPSKPINSPNTLKNSSHTTPLLSESAKIPAPVIVNLLINTA